MQKLNLNMTLRARAVYLKGRAEPIRDCVIQIAGNFLVVGRDEGDESPIWYNMDSVDHLEGVARIPPTAKSWITVWG